MPQNYSVFSFFVIVVAGGGGGLFFHFFVPLSVKRGFKVELNQ